MAFLHKSKPDYSKFFLILQLILLFSADGQEPQSANDSIERNGRLRVPSPFVDMDEDFLRLSLQAAELSTSIMRPTVQEEYPEATVFVDEPDQAMVVKIDDICFAVFRGTLISSSADVAQNLNTATALDVCHDGICCATRQGYRDAFLGAGYYDQFESTLIDCASSCCQDGGDCLPSNKCEVVLTGFSQGGAAAQVGAVILRDLSPTTITFGQPPTMVAPCEPLDTDRYFRFINTVNAGGKLKYDAAPFVEYGGALQTGHSFVLGEATTGVPYYKDRAAPDIGLLDWFPIFLVVHNIELYADRLKTLLGTGDFPISLNGFDDGSPCTRNSECASSNCFRSTCSLEVTLEPTSSPNEPPLPNPTLSILDDESSSAMTTLPSKFEMLVMMMVPTIVWYCKNFL